MRQIMRSLHFESLSFRYSPNDPFVFREVTLEIPSGQTVLLLGDNGTGKSTFGRLICGLIHPTFGTVFVEDQEICRVEPETRIELAYFIPQENQLQFVKNTLDEEIRLTQKLARKQNVGPEIFTRYQIHSDPTTHPLDLSVNEGWRFSLLLSSVILPKVLFIDEIPSWSNKNNKSVFIELLNQRKSLDLITIFSFQREVGLMFERTLLVGSGKIYDK
jgi:energy-coupling factor transporter ATP-binding protein EcfA2